MQIRAALRPGSGRPAHLKETNRRCDLECPVPPVPAASPLASDLVSALSPAQALPAQAERSLMISHTLVASTLRWPRVMPAAQMPRVMPAARTPPSSALTACQPAEVPAPTALSLPGGTHQLPSLPKAGLLPSSLFPGTLNCHPRATRPEPGRLLGTSLCPLPVSRTRPSTPLAQSTPRGQEAGRRCFSYTYCHGPTCLAVVHF